MRKTILSLTLLAVASIASAGDFHVQVHVASVHATQRADVPWNESNDGFGLRYSLNDTWSVQAGHYRNEQTVPGVFNFFTNYGLVDYTPVHRGQFHFGGFAGVQSGYDEYDIKVGGPRPKVTVTQDSIISPTYGLMGRWQGDRFNVGLRLTAPQSAAGSLAIALEGGVRF
jgi:hypothetical protein